MSYKITIPAKLASCVREGLHTEFGTAMEHLAGLTERAGERSFEVYGESLERQAEAQVLLEEIGGETPDPPTPIEVVARHLPVLLRVLEGQRQSYAERLDDFDGDEQRETTELIHELDTLIRIIETR